MPMDSGRHLEPVLQPDVEHVALIEGEAIGTRAVADAVTCRRLAGDLDLVRRDAQRPGAPCGARGGYHAGKRKSGRSGEESPP
jgi:hypothetical protein